MTVMMQSVFAGLLDSLPFRAMKAAEAVNALCLRPEMEVSAAQTLRHRIETFVTALLLRMQPASAELVVLFTEVAKDVDGDENVPPTAEALMQMATHALKCMTSARVWRGPACELIAQRSFDFCMSTAKRSAQMGLWDPIG